MNLANGYRSSDAPLRLCIRAALRKQPETISYRLAEGGSSRHSELAERRDFLDKEIRPDPNLWTKSQHNEQLVANAPRRNIRARPTPHSMRKESVR